jgi:universal stress protein E
VVALQTILAAVGPAGDASPAAAPAAALARVTGATLRLVRRVDDPRMPLYEALVAEARDVAADLLVTASSRASGGHAGTLTQADWQIIRHSPCPVLFTRGNAVAGYRDILVAVDPVHEHDRPSALDDELVALGATLASACGATLRLLHCYLPAQYVPFRAPGAISTTSLQRRPNSMEAHRDALQALAKRHGIVEACALLEPADPRDGIPDTAGRLGADLVVMGAVARSRLRRLLIGSTAEPVLDRLACDFLVMKPPAAKA